MRKGLEWSQWKEEGEERKRRCKGKCQEWGGRERDMAVEGRVAEGVKTGPEWSQIKMGSERGREGEGKEEKIGEGQQNRQA